MAQRIALMLLMFTGIAALGCEEASVGEVQPRNPQSEAESTVSTSASAADSATEVTATKAEADKPGEVATAVFAGGCFWCVEAVFEELEGVHDAISGYSGGKAETANYKAVTTGATGHAEAVEIRYDPSKITFEKLLAVHFATHDPTTLNRQGADVGPQYRSAIFYKDEGEKKAAEAMIDRLNKSGTFNKPIVTTLEPLEKFYEAEQYHQNYVCENPYQPYILGVAMPKVEKVRKLFKDDLKSTAAERKKKEAELNKSDEGAKADGPKVKVYVYNDAGELTGPVEQAKVIKSEAEWKQQLSEEQFRILRKSGTERAFCGTLLDNKKEGTYICAGCSLPLFSSDHKFKSGTGWPSFYTPVGGKHNVAEKVDKSYGMVRTEILCARCDGHLGHVFNDGPKPTGLRYCLNSESLLFVEKDKIKDKLAEVKSAQ